MRSFLLFSIMAIALALASCAGPNGAANGTHHGASARADIFRIPLP